MSESGCLLCGGETRPWLTVPTDWRRPGAGGPYRLRWCDGCGFGQVHPRPSAGEVASYYAVDEYYTHGENGRPRGGSGPRNPSLRALGKLVWRFDRGAGLGAVAAEELVSEYGIRTVCDLGCGNGRALMRFRDAGCEVVGVDIDPDALAVAGANGVPVIQGTAEDLPREVGARTYDLVLMRHSLEHCLQPDVVIGNAARLLGGGGYLLCEVPNNEALGLAMMGQTWPWLDVPRHLNFFTARSLHRLCGGHGLAVLRTRFTGYTRQFSDHWLGMQHRISERCGGRAGGCAEPWRPMRLWGLALRTMLASPRRKYDSVGVLARCDGV